MDVGITPYRDTPFNRASFPLKTLEYLGAGLPVVSADLPAARWLRANLTDGEHAAAADRILTVARSNAEFTDAIRRIVDGGPYPARVAPSPGRHGRDRVRADQCVAFASTHTWARRADAFASAIGLPQPQSLPAR